MNMKKKLKVFFGEDYKRYMKIATAVLSAMSAFSICVFFHMRHAGNAAAYYFDKSATMAADLFAHPAYLCFALLIPVFASIYFFCLNNKTQFSLGCIVCGALFTIFVEFSLSMEASGMTSVLFPLRAIGLDMVIHIIAVLGFFSLFFFLTHVLYSLLDSKAMFLAGRSWPMGKEKKAFWIALLLIGLGWTPGFIMCWPGSMHGQTLSLLKGYLGKAPMDISDPALSAAFYGALYSIGLRLGGSQAGVVLCALGQAALCCPVMALTACKVREYAKSNLGYAFVIFLYGLCPVWQRAVQFSMSDVLHTAFFLLFLMRYLSCLTEERTDFKSVLGLFACAAAVSLTRPLAFWIAFISVLALILHRRKAYRIKYGLCLILLTGCYFLSVFLLFPALHFTNEHTQEAFSLPFQQVAMYYDKNPEKITDERKAVIDGTLDYDEAIDQYTPLSAAPVLKTYHGSAKDHQAFFRLYLQLFLEHPVSFIKSFIMNSFEYLNPWYPADKNANIYIARDTALNADADYMNDGRRWKMNLYWGSWASLPVLRFSVSIGAYAWMMLAMLGYAFYRRCFRAFLGALPVLLVWLGFFFSDANGLVRYAYPLIAAVPLICAYTVYEYSKKVAIEHPHMFTEPVNKKRSPLQWLKTFGDMPGHEGFYNI